MWRTTLRAIGASLLWCASWGAAAGVEAPRIDVGPAVAQGNLPIPLHAHSLSWIDERGTTTIQDVDRAGDSLPWQPRRADQADRVNRRALWIRFDVQPAAPGSWFLEVGAPGIDRVQLFHRDAGGDWVVQESGDGRAMASWPVPGRFPSFALARGETGATRYWMRVEHTRMDFAAPLTLYRETVLLAKREREQFLLGAYFGIAVLLAAAALASGLAYRDRAFLAFALYIVVIGAGQLARAGVGAQHLWPHWPRWNELAVIAWPGLPVAAALWFVKVVTEPARLARSLDWGVGLLIAGVLAAVAADAVLRTRVSMVVVLALTGLSLAAVVAMLGWGWLDGRDPDIKLVALGFLPVVLLALLPLARAFNLLPISDVTRYAVFTGTVIAMPILYYALQVRSMRRRESEVRAAALSHNDALTGLPHRRAFLERLETTLARARSHKQTVALLGVRVANMDSVADEFGRDAAEKALVVAASHLRRMITDVDMAARVDEQDFALLLESPVSGPVAISRAQQVIASGLRPAAALPPSLILKFHVTVALLPQDDLGGVASLQWAMGGLDQVALDGRRAIRPLNFPTA